jgi:DNA-binding IclR family transcriptional regulator
MGKVVAAFLSRDELERMLRSEQMVRFTARTITGVEDLKAELARVRRLGYAINDEETVDGIIVIGCPIYDVDRNVCGAVSVSALADRCDASRRKQIVQATQRSANVISDDLQSLAFALTG